MLDFFKDFWSFLKVRKKFWLLPIFITLLVLAGLIFFSQSTALPLIYTIF